jgi:hypothetical protein
MRNVHIDVPEFGVGLVDHHSFVRSLNKIERLKADKDQELWDVQLTRDTVCTPRASGPALASLKRSTTKGFRFGLFKSAKLSGASTTSPLSLGVCTITGCACSYVWTGRRWKEIPPAVIEAMKLDFIELAAFRGFRKAVRVDSYGPLASSAGGTESKRAPRAMLWNLR